MSLIKTPQERYTHYCQAIETTELYTEYSFYSLIASCLQRRVWLNYGDWPIFANIYPIFVGEPGTGKTNAARVNKNILKKMGEDPKTKKPIIPVAPDTISVEALIRKLSFGLIFFKDSEGNPHAMSPMTFISEELGNLFKKDDQQLVKFLIQGYDSDDYSKELKGNGTVNSFETVSKLCLNFLAATTPTNMNDFMCRGLMEDGFLGRALFIWGGHPKKRILLYTPNVDQIVDLKYVEDYCRILTQVTGACTLSTEALLFAEDWLENGFVILNEDRKLQHYYPRKKINLMKLAMCIHFGKDYRSFEIQIDDVKEALDALARIELDMHLALASMSKNPIHNLSQMVVSFLENRKRSYPNQADKYRKTIKDLQLIFGSECEPTVLNSAVQYCILQKRLTIGSDKGEVYYEGK